MSGVAFPLPQFRQKQAIRQEYNELDKSTIFSILPIRIEERKPTLLPGLFIIEPGSEKRPTRLVVGTSSWFREIDETQPLIEIPTSSVVVARSVVDDYCNGILACNMSDSMPGLFWLPGDVPLNKLQSDDDIPPFTKEEKENPHRIKRSYKSVFAESVKKQRKWFERLINFADALWARTNGSSLAISDDMRMAARELDIQNKAWLATAQAMHAVPCKACGAPRNPDYPICPVCKAINDEALATKLGIKFAQV